MVENELPLSMVLKQPSVWRISLGWCHSFSCRSCFTVYVKCYRVTYMVINEPGPTVVDTVHALSHLTFTGTLHGQAHYLPEPRETGSIPEPVNRNPGLTDSRAHPCYLASLSCWHDHNLFSSKINAWTKEPGRLQSMRSQKSRTWLSDYAMTKYTQK